MIPVSFASDIFALRIIAQGPFCILYIPSLSWDDAKPVELTPLEVK